LVFRPQLRGLDVVHAVQTTLAAWDAPRILSVLLSQFQTDLSETELATRMDWTLTLRRDLANFLCERILQVHIAGQSPAVILLELTFLLDLLSAAPQ